MKGILGIQPDLGDEVANDLIDSSPNRLCLVRRDRRGRAEEDDRRACLTIS